MQITDEVIEVCAKLLFQENQGNRTYEHDCWEEQAQSLWNLYAAGEINDEFLLACYRIGRERFN